MGSPAIGLAGYHCRKEKWDDVPLVMNEVIQKYTKKQRAATYNTGGYESGTIIIATKNVGAYVNQDCPTDTFGDVPREDFANVCKRR
jgi:hypothetical protein